MKLGIISTIGTQYTWAGSEEMWRGVAATALDDGLMVTIHTAEKIANSCQVAELKAKGTISYSRPSLSALTRRLANRNLYSRYQSFFAQHLDVLCLSMGGIADCVWMPDLLQAINRTNIPYIVIVQANAEGIITEEEHRQILRKFYAKAASVIFVSRHNYLLAERQLGMSFLNPKIICNPLRESEIGRAHV